MPFTTHRSTTKNLLHVTVEGDIFTTQDYNEILIPEITKILEKSKTIRVLVEAPNLTLRDSTIANWFSLWDDHKIGLTKSQYMSHFAVVCKRTTIQKKTAIPGFTRNTKVKIFSMDEKTAAHDWVTSVFSKSPASFKSDDVTKYLVAIGQSPESQSAIYQAIKLLTRRRDDDLQELHLIGVIKEGENANEESLMDILEDAASEAASALRLRSKDARKTTIISHQLAISNKEKSIAWCIVERANTLEVDYIIMVTEHTGQSFISGLLHPSVATEVIKTANCPVVICNAFPEEDGK